MTGKNRRPPRRGVLLVIVLSLLAMFALVGLTFVLVSSQQRRGAQAAGRVDQYADPAPQLLHDALAQVMRGTRPPAATNVRTYAGIGAHSLLETMYGNGAVGGSFNSVSQVNSGQVLQIPIAAAANSPVTAPRDVNSMSADERVQLAGRVITLVDGPAAGCSTRIIGFTSNGPGLQLLATLEISYAQLSGYVGGASKRAVNYVINGAPFSGTGFGWNATNGTFTANYALQPNFWTSTKINSRNPEGYGASANSDYTAVDYQHMLLAMNIPQDVATQFSGGVTTPIPSMHRPELLRYWAKRNNVPTFTSRSDYPAFYQAASAVAQAVSFRPIGAEATGKNSSSPNPKFTGSNLKFNPFWDGVYDAANQWQWDVDNDGDGWPDSIWVDLGFPVRSMPDGRRYKPLAAILCIDMDGRLNLNAHGCPQQVAGNYTTASTLPNTTDFGSSLPPAVNGGYPQFNGGAAAGNTPTASNLTPPNALPTQSISLPKGQGYGPAEINLLPLFQTPISLAAAGQSNLMYGLSTTTPFTPGRYGESSTSARPGRTGLPNAALLNRWFDYGGNYWSFLTGGSYYVDSYGTPPDVEGNCAIGLDLCGRPIYWGLGRTANINTWVNSPYELNLSAAQAWHVDKQSSGKYASGNPPTDNPFKPAEFEALLRMYDSDSGALPNRIATLLQLTNATTSATKLALLRQEVTTESWHVPVPGGAMLATTAGTPTALPTNASTKPNAEPYSPPGGLVGLLLSKNISSTQWPLLFSPDMLAGLPMDINRPFGPAWDEDNNGVPDAPRYDTSQRYFRPVSQTTSGVQAPFKNSPTGVTSIGTANVQFDASNQGSPAAVAANNTTTGGVRETYARNLYVLACLLCNPANVQTRAAALLPNATHAGAQMLAQWAVNVVDFRDHDSIMTCFHYDPLLFENLRNGTSLGSWTWTPSAVVFGCERPELLLMETLALHDRRIDDTNQETVDPAQATPKGTRKGPGQETDPATPASSNTHDPDFDQQWVPQGSLFVKLYNPWTTYDAPSGDLHKSARGWNQGVYLDQIAPKANADPSNPSNQYIQASPVWRLAITKPVAADGSTVATNETTLTDPDADPTKSNAKPPQIYRSAYFVDLAASCPGFAKLVVSEQASIYGAAATNYPYYASAGNNGGGQVAPVLPGRYAVVGSGERTTNPVSKLTPTGITATSTPIGMASGASGFAGTNRQISLTPNSNPATNQVSILNYSGYARPGSAQPSVAVVVDSAYVNGAAQPRRLSVSEPDPTTTDYYPTSGSKNSALAGGKYAKAYDHPLDQFIQNPSDGSSTGKAPSPNIWDEVLKSNPLSFFHPAFRMVHLQRLANPLRPWDPNIYLPGGTKFNPTYNPYRTVDSMLVDLSVFNGVSAKTGTNPWEKAGTPVLVSRERGLNDFLSYYKAARHTVFNLWKQEPIENPTPYSDTHYANASTYPTITGQIISKSLVQTLGYMNHTYGTARSSPGNYAGEPGYPLPWLTWNNRPYISPLELMLVPWTSSSQLLRPMNFTINGITATGTPQATNPYAGTQSAIPGANNYYDPTVSTNPFVHLMDFFDSSTQMYRVLEYLRVPSRFVGNDTVLDPATYQSPSNAANPPTPQTHQLYPPFNVVCGYREPGRINLNTLFSPRAWKGLMNGYPEDSGTTNTSWANTNLNGSSGHSLWTRFITSRRGYTPAAAQANNPLAIDPTNPLPTRFANPFRAFGGWNFMANKPAAEIDVTLLRPDPADGTRPLFQFDATITPKKSDGLALTAIQHPENPDRNPYFRYQGLQRLANLTTTRSNVYAVWITIGFFEAIPNSDLTTHPDGYELGAEIGADTGDVKRPRGFFLIDRTIPVGFLRGENLNYDKAVLVDRIVP